MTSPGTLSPTRPSPLPLRRWRITVDEFERMLQAGIFKEDDPIELIEGELFESPATGDWHNSGVDALNHILSTGTAELAFVRSQGSVRLDEFSAPQPDITLLRFRSDFYRDGGAGPEDVLLVVEVSDSSARSDREVKLPLYARAGIPEVWIVTREPAVIEAYRSPREGTYTEMRTYLRDDVVSPQALPGVRITVSSVTG